MIGHMCDDIVTPYLVSRGSECHLVLLQICTLDHVPLILLVVHVRDWKLSDGSVLNCIIIGILAALRGARSLKLRDFERRVRLVSHHPPWDTLASHHPPWDILAGHRSVQRGLEQPKLNFYTKILILGKPPFLPICSAVPLQPNIVYYR